MINSFKTFFSPSLPMGRRGRGTPRERDSPHCGNHWVHHQPSQTSWQSHSCEATTTLPGCGWGRDGPEKQEEIFVKISCVLTVVVAPSQKAAYSPTSVVSRSTDFNQYSIPSNSRGSYKQLSERQTNQGDPTQQPKLGGKHRECWHHPWSPPPQHSPGNTCSRSCLPETKKIWRICLKMKTNLQQPTIRTLVGILCQGSHHQHTQS